MKKSIFLTALLLGCTLGTPQRPWYERTWEWSLDRPPETVNAHVYVLDPVATDAATVDELHEKKRRAVCYIDLAKVTGSERDRVRLCHDKGFDGAVLRGDPSDGLTAYTKDLGLMVFDSAGKRTTIDS